MTKNNERINNPESRIEKVRERFENWRTTRLRIGKIPEELWEAAINLYPEYRIFRIAEILRLNYSRLKKKILNHSKKESNKLNSQKESNKSSAKKESNKLNSQKESNESSSKKESNNLRIEQIQEQLEDYRRNQKKRTPIPKQLWEAVINLYPKYNIHQIARTLRLNYASVKKRIVQLQKKKAPPVTPAFIQLDIPSPPKLPEPDQNEWSIEMENADGAKMRIGVKSSQMLDIGIIFQSFLRSQG